MGKAFIGNFMGPTGPQGPQGPPGEIAAMPSIGSNGNWFIGERDTGVLADVDRALSAKIVASTEISEPGFIMDGKTASEKFAELNSKIDDGLKSLIIYKSYTKDNVSIPAGSSLTVDVNAPQIEGYGRILWTVRCENASSGGIGVSYSTVWGSDIDGDNISVGIRNNTSTNAIKIKVVIRMIHVKAGYYGS